MQVSSCPNMALAAPVNRPKLVGRASLTLTPTPAQTRLLVFILASHEATATEFREVKVPLKLLFPDLAPLAREQAVSSLFGNKNSPGFDIRATDAAGDLIFEGDYCFMPLLSCLSYRRGSRHVAVKLNSRLFDYLPQFLALVPLATLAPPIGQPEQLQLAA